MVYVLHTQFFPFNSGKNMSTIVPRNEVVKNSGMCDYTYWSLLLISICLLKMVNCHEQIGHSSFENGQLLWAEVWLRSKNKNIWTNIFTLGEIKKISNIYFFIIWISEIRIWTWIFLSLYIYFLSINNKIKYMDDYNFGNSYCLTNQF